MAELTIFLDYLRDNCQLHSVFSYNKQSLLVFWMKHKISKQKMLVFRFMEKMLVIQFHRMDSIFIIKFHSMEIMLDLLLSYNYFCSMKLYERV